VGRGLRAVAFQGGISRGVPDAARQIPRPAGENAGLRDDGLNCSMAFHGQMRRSFVGLVRETNDSLPQDDKRGPRSRATSSQWAVSV